MELWLLDCCHIGIFHHQALMCWCICTRMCSTLRILNLKCWSCISWPFCITNCQKYLNLSIYPNLEIQLSSSNVSYFSSINILQGQQAEVVGELIQWVLRVSLITIHHWFGWWLHTNWVMNHYLNLWWQRLGTCYHVSQSVSESVSIKCGRVTMGLVMAAHCALWWANNVRLERL